MLLQSVSLDKTHHPFSQAPPTDNRQVSIIRFPDQKGHGFEQEIDPFYCFESSHKKKLVPLASLGTRRLLLPLRLGDTPGCRQKEASSPELIFNFPGKIKAVREDTCGVLNNSLHDPTHERNLPIAIDV